MPGERRQRSARSATHSWRGAGVSRDAFLLAFLLIAAGLSLWAIRERQLRFARGPTPGARGSPIHAVRELLEARRRLDYSAVAQGVIAEQASQVASLLLAVDYFKNSNDRLVAAVRDQVGIGVSQIVDQSAWASRLDIFSEHIELLDEHIDGDVATVSFVINREVPARLAKLRWDGDRWRYDPGAGDADALARAFTEMAHGLDACRADLDAGRIRADAVFENPQVLIDEILVRMRPGIRALPPPSSP